MVLAISVLPRLEDNPDIDLYFSYCFHYLLPFDIFILCTVMPLKVGQFSIIISRKMIDYIQDPARFSCL